MSWRADKNPKIRVRPQSPGPENLKLADGWTSDEEYLNYDLEWKGTRGDAKEWILKMNPEYDDVRPLLANWELNLYLIEVTLKEGEERKYFIFNDISDELFEVIGSLEDIIAVLSEPADPAVLFEPADPAEPVEPAEPAAN